MHELEVDDHVSKRYSMLTTLPSATMSQHLRILLGYQRLLSRYLPGTRIEGAS